MRNNRSNFGASLLLMCCYMWNVWWTCHSLCVVLCVFYFLICVFVWLLGIQENWYFSGNTSAIVEPHTTILLYLSIASLFLTKKSERGASNVPVTHSLITLLGLEARATRSSSRFPSLPSIDFHFWVISKSFICLCYFCCCFVCMNSTRYNGMTNENYCASLSTHCYFVFDCQVLTRRDGFSGSTLATVELHTTYLLYPSIAKILPTKQSERGASNVLVTHPPISCLGSEARVTRISHSLFAWNCYPSCQQMNSWENLGRRTTMHWVLLKTKTMKV